MLQKGIFSIMILLLVASCGSSNQVDREVGFGTMTTQKKDIVPDFYWVSLASNGDKAVKNSRPLMSQLISLIQKPKNNLLTAKNIGGRFDAKIEIKPSTGKREMGVVASFNFYKVYLKGKGGVIRNGVPFKLNFEFKAIEDVEKTQIDQLKVKVKEYFKAYCLKKYQKKDFDITAHYQVTKIDNVEYKRNILSYRVHLVLSSIKEKKIDYTLSPDAFAKKVEVAIQGGDFKKAKKLNEKFKTITIDKKIYYRYGMLISDFSGDTNYGLNAAIGIINDFADRKSVKNGIQVFKNTYNQKLSKKKKRRVMKWINRLIKRYYRKKLNNIELSKNFQKIMKKYPLK